MKVFVNDGLRNVEMLAKNGRTDLAKRLLSKIELLIPKEEKKKVDKIKKGI